MKLREISHRGRSTVLWHKSKKLSDRSKQLLEKSEKLRKEHPLAEERVWHFVQSARCVG